MPLSPGSKLGSYEVLAALGAGGMGEVYRARDTRLGREVAIKVLPAERLTDESRRRRFVQEARAASALNHPNIVTIYEIESADGIDFIVMEYVLGKTLAQRIVSPMRVEDVLRLAIPIADALTSAHAAGIVHRDLKPGNIVVSNDGVVKLLDFGLAKLVADSGSNPEGETAPTASQPLSRPGVVAGTPGYMSPEQATGGRVDARSDVFAFGAVLYEMVTARRVFARSSTAETLAALLREVPTPPSELVAHVPRQLEKLIQRCLAKDPTRRSQHMADVKVELQEVRDELGAPIGPDSPPRRLWPAAVALATALGLGVGVGLALRPSAAKSSGPVTRFSIPLPEGTRLAQNVPSVAISRNGSKLVVAAQRGRNQELYVRELAGSEWKRLPATEETGSPFFSPDGEWVGFFTAGRLNRIAVRGGTPQTVCGVLAVQRGNNTAVWGEDGWITYAGWPAPGLWRCPAAGGAAERLSETEPAAAPRPVFYSCPKWLSGARAVLFGTWTPGHARIEALSMTTGQKRLVVDAGSSPSYAATGHLLHGWDNQILAASFNADTLDTRSAPIAVVEGVRMGGGMPGQLTDYALSDNGTLVYVPGRKPERKLVRIDRTGQVEPLALPAGDYSFPTLSPTGDRVAIAMTQGAGRDIWIGDLGRGSVSRLTGDDDSVFTLWSPDGKDVIYTSSQPGQYNLFRKGVDGSAPPTRLTESAHAQRATSWSPDGRLVLFNSIDPNTRVDVWLLQLDGARATSPLLNTTAREQSATFSPDGKWIAYQSDESGRFEVYVQSFPQAGERRQVSNDGGIQPSWNRNGRELIYTADDRLMSVSFDARQGVHLGRPEVLFRTASAASLRLWAEYSLTPDGRGFLFLEDAAPAAAPARLEVVVNWFQELKQRVPVVR